MNRTFMRAAGAGIVASWIVAGSLMAGEVDPRLIARLEPVTAHDVQRNIDRARAEGLPTEPLVLKALEGAAKGAPDQVIVAAVRRNAQAMQTASRALGPRTTEPELVAGAAAVLAGAAPDSLRSLRAARGESSLVVPLVVISDLLARRVPAREATQIIVASWREGISSAALLRMREWIHHDIQGGVAPSTAALRARATYEREGSRSPGAARPPTPPSAERTDKK